MNNRPGGSGRPQGSKARRDSIFSKRLLSISKPNASRTFQIAFRTPFHPTILVRLLQRVAEKLHEWFRVVKRRHDLV